MADWNPAKYAQFGGLRLRPALDLLAQVPDLPAGDVVDLGCGNGPVGPALAARFGRAVTGVDSSPAMLAKAKETGAYTTLIEADATRWKPENAPALIYSNALCHWLPDHGTLFPRLAGMLAPGGALAVQMPRQQMAPSHALMRQIGAEMFPQLFDFSDWAPQVSEPAYYARLLAPLGRVSVWETEYMQRLDPVEAGHPVRHFTQSTALRPFAEKLDDAGLAGFITAYETALTNAYPPEADGTVLFPFRRLFFVLTR